MTRRLALVCGLVFVAALAGHFGYLAWREARVAAHWVAIEEAARPSALVRYIERQDFWLGYSYALAASFTALAVTLTLQQRRREVGGVLGGVTLMGGLYAAGCFLIGCCGSPMLTVYISLFGASILGFLKPIVAVITTISVVLSGIYLVRRSRRSCCTSSSSSSPLLRTSVSYREEK